MGQTIVLVVVPEIAKLVHEVSHDARNDADHAGGLRDVMNWLLFNSIEKEALMQAQHLSQSVRNVARRHALDCLEKSYSTAGECSPPGAGPSHDPCSSRLGNADVPSFI